MEELDFRRFLLLSLERYLDMPNSAFYFDDKDSEDFENYKLFMECIEEIKKADNTASFYVSTYAELENGMIYSDNLLIRTKLSKEEICKVFYTNREIEPYYIEKMTEEERDAVEWIDLDKKAFDDDKAQIFSLYWD